MLSGFSFRQRHTRPEKLENAALFLQLHANGPDWSVTKTELFVNVLQTGGIFKCRLCVFMWTKNILKIVCSRLSEVGMEKKGEREKKWGRTKARSLSPPSFFPRSFSIVPTKLPRAWNRVFENGAFWKQCNLDNHVIFVTEFSSNTNPKWLVLVAFLNSSSALLTENITCVFRVKSQFSNVVWTAP